MATTRAGWPYPVGTDRVMDGDDAIAAVATRLDNVVGFGFAAGSASGPAPTAVNAQTTVAITYPAGRFTAAPNLMATYGGGVGSWQTCPIVTSGNGPTGANLNYAIPTGWPLAGRTISWLAWGN